MDRCLPSTIGSKINMAVVVSNALIIGLNTGWPGATFPKILNGKLEFAMTLGDLALTVIYFYVGQVTSLIPFAYLDRTIGKRRIAQLGIHFSVAGWLTIILLRRKLGVYLGMFFFGNWATLSLLSLGPYLAEIASPKIRGKVLSLMAVFFMFGAIFESFLGMYLTYGQIAITNEIITLTQSLAQLSLPETPYFYLQRGNVVKAKQLFEWLRGSEGKEDFNMAVICVKKQMERQNSFLDIFRNEQSRRALYFSVILTTFQKLSANVPLTTYSSLMLPPSFIQPIQFPILFFTIAFVFNFLSGSIIDKVGRRKLLLLSSFGSCLCSIGTAVWYLMVEQFKNNLTKYPYVPYILFASETTFYALGTQFIPYIIDSELFGVNIKAKALSLVLFVQILYNAINSPIFILFVKYKATFLVFAFYATISAVGFFYYIHMYDTKGKTLEEIYDHFESRGQRLTTQTHESLVTEDDQHSSKSSSLRIQDDTRNNHVIEIE